MQELPAPSGMSTFRAELMTDSTRNAAKSPGRGSCSDDKAVAISTAPSSDHGVHVKPAARTTHH